MAQIDIEIEAHQVADLMIEDPQFASDLWVEMANRINMGLMKDNAADGVSTLSREHVKFLATQYRELARAMVDGARRKCLTQIKE
jgi:hypothetical protein